MSPRPLPLEPARPRGTVFFEAITPLHRPLVAGYLALGWRVRVFDFSYRLKRMSWMRRLLEEKVERIYVHINSQADGLAIDAAEWLYPRFESHPLVRAVGAIFGQAESEAPFKHALVESASRYFFTRLYLERELQTGGRGARVEFIPDAYRSWDRTLRPWCALRGMKPLDGARIPLFPALWSEAGRGWEKAAQQVPQYLSQAALFTLAGLLRAARRTGPKRVRCTYVYAVNSRFQTKFGAGRRYDFLLDGRRLTRENTLFLVHPSGEGPWLQEARRAGCRLLLGSDYSGLSGFLRHPPVTLPVGPALRGALEGLLRPGAPDWLHAAAGAGLGILLQELSLLERLKFSHYIYANQYRLTPRWRNILIRRAGAQSWWFAYSNGGGQLYPQYGPFGGDGDFGGRHRFWAYENADHFVSPCASLIEYHRLHRQRIGRYHDVGNIWSEQILEVQSRIRAEETRAAWFQGQEKGRKVVAWFDTSFIEAPNSPSTFTEAIQSYRDILRLVSEEERLCAVVKPSKQEGYFVGEGPERQWAIPRLGRVLMEVWSEMKRHPRIRLLPSDADPTVAVAASDLTVTFHVSSVTAEALGARKRGIWYEPGQRWRNAPLGKDPLLAAHGYEELQVLVRKLLFEVGEAEYEAFLEEKVRGLVESWMDGKGLSRFRDLLAGANPSSRIPAAAAMAGARG